jgi:glycosyltransferase involved in cell wall biosynthesis
MIKVSHLASGDLWAGAEVQLYHLCKHLKSKRDIRVHVILFNDGQLASSLKRVGIEVTVFDEHKLNFIQLYSRLHRYCSENQIDIIHTHRFKENILGSLVAKTLKIVSLRTVHGDNELKASSLKSRIINWLNIYAAKKVQRNIVAVSDELANKLKASFPSCRIHTINNGIDVDHLQERSLLNSKDMFSSDSINIGFVGRFVPVKRVDLFIDIALNLIKSDSSCKLHFHLIGDGPLKPVIEKKIKDSGHKDFFTLWGFVENTAPFIKQLNYVVFTSEHEGLPMTLLEAMALKTSVISVKLPSLKTVLEESKGGFFVDSDNPKIIADFIYNKVLSRDKSNMVDFAFNKLKQEYDISKTAQTYYDLYRSIRG